MTSVHPAFDVETRTWFVTKPRNAEAPTIRALLAKLGPDFTAEGYRPAGSSPLVIQHAKIGEATTLRPDSPALVTIGHPKRKRTPPMPIAAIDAVKPAVDQRRPLQNLALAGRDTLKAVAKAKLALPVDKPLARPKAKIEPVFQPVASPPVDLLAPAPSAAALQVGEWERQIKAQVDVDLLKIKRRSPVQTYPKPEREPWRSERQVWSERENAALDAWAAGENGVAIALRLGMTHAQVAARLVPNARLVGDPRAVVRNPKKFGYKYRKGCTA